MKPRAHLRAILDALPDGARAELRQRALSYPVDGLEAALADASDTTLRERAAVYELAAAGVPWARAVQASLHLLNVAIDLARAAEGNHLRPFASALGEDYTQQRLEAEAQAGWTLLQPNDPDEIVRRGIEQLLIAARLEERDADGPKWKAPLIVDVFVELRHLGIGPPSVTPPAAETIDVDGRCFEHDLFRCRDCGAAPRKPGNQKLDRALLRYFEASAPGLKVGMKTISRIRKEVIGKATKRG